MMLLIHVLQVNELGVSCAASALVFSHPSHSVPPQAAETGANQRLPADGGGVHQESGADEASGGETGGQPLLRRAMANFVSLL